MTDTTTNQPGEPERVASPPEEIYINPSMVFDGDQHNGTVKYVRADLVGPAEMDVRAVVETWAAELADPIPYDTDAAGPIPKPVTIPSVDVEMLISRLATYMGQPATERARAAAEEIVHLLKPGRTQREKKVYADTVAAIITRHLSASRGEGGGEWSQKVKEIVLSTSVLDRTGAQVQTAIITALEEMEMERGRESR